MHFRALGIITITTTLALLLAGCSSSPGGAGAEDAAEEASQQGAAQAGGPYVAECVFQRTAVNTPLGAGLNVDDVPQCMFLDAPLKNLKRINSAVVEATTSPVLQGVSFRLRLHSDICRESEDTVTGVCLPPLYYDAEGTDSIRLELDQAFFDLHRDANPGAYVWSDGASMDQDFKVVISLFESPTVPAGYSALTP